ncbi:cytochrome P450 [Penicillium hispanicum]|uniref:cytochrome P450 n=1 Tax=Penicillium hispanicum TaxID=1080232 RepID=UPI002541A753|nr:cytochrome P450 [Penicillium hispanicum]KAJ5584759.1 cytochrome P450 [Penicillium hispanicum]
MLQRRGLVHSFVPCIAKDILKAQHEEGFSDDLASYICGFLLIAGSDTIATQLTVFIQAMVLYPEVQRTAQAEVDRVCGERLPEEQDQKHMPYIHAMIKETCRWMPAAILGIPHSNIEEDEYMGYTIPKDSVIITNVWAIHNDPRRHHDGRTFDPTRYLHDKKSTRESALSPDVTERDHFLFGSGRRLCAGMDIAENSLFLSMARIPWTFNISKAVDNAGNEITPDPDNIVGGLAAMPAQFPAQIVPRSEQRAKAVQKEWDVAQENLKGEDGQWNRVPQDLPFA